MKRQALQHKTIAVSPATHAQLEAIARKFDLTHRDLVEHMVKFFKKSKLDPRQAPSENIDVQLEKINKSINEKHNAIYAQNKAIEENIITKVITEVGLLFGHVMIDDALNDGYKEYYKKNKDAIPLREQKKETKEPVKAKPVSSANTGIKENDVLYDQLKQLEPDKK